MWVTCDSQADAFNCQWICLLALPLPLSPCFIWCGSALQKQVVASELEGEHVPEARCNAVILEDSFEFNHGIVGNNSYGAQDGRVKYEKSWAWTLVRVVMVVIMASLEVSTSIMVPMVHMTHL